MDKQNNYSARPQGFRGNSRPAPAKAQEEAPKKKPAAKKAAPKVSKKRTKRSLQHRKRISARLLLIIIAVALVAALTAFFVIRGVINSKNKTVHMLPEIYDVQTAEPTASPFMAGEGAPESLDAFMAEVGGA